MEVLEERREDRKIHKVEEEMEGKVDSKEEWERKRTEEGEREREDHKGPGRCFSVDSFLSSQECKYFISLATSLGFQDLSHEYDPKYRNSKRVLFSSSYLAKQLYGRVENLFCVEDIVHAKPYGFYKAGTWKPVGLNNVFKVSSYEEDTHFRPHFDGCFVVSDTCRSIFTLLIYLNNDFEGGETRFFKTLGDKTNPVVTPVTGRMLVFNHDLRHEGAKVMAGKKYIIKTEVLFRRIDVFTRPSLIKIPKGNLHSQSRALYQQADNLERKGDVAGATSAYLKAQELQLQYKAEISPKEPTENGPFVLHIFLLIIRYLPIAEQLKCASVNYAWHKMVHTDVVWHQNYSVYFPEHFAVESSLNKVAKREDKAFLKDWATMFKRSHVYQYSKCNTICVDLGSNYTSVCNLETKRQITEYTLVGREYHPHFVMAGLSLMDSWRMGNETSNGCNVRGIIKPYFNGEVVDWSALWLFLNYAFHSCGRNQSRFKKPPPVYAQMHPVLFSEGRKPLDRAHLYYTMFMLFETPAVCIENSAILALCAFGKTSGIVVDCGCSETVVTPVVDGVVLKDFERIYPIGGGLLGKMLDSITPSYETEHRPGSVIAWWGEVFLDFDRDMPTSTTTKNLSNPGRVEERNATLLTVEAYFDPKRSAESKVPFPQSAMQTPFVNFVFQTIMECEEEHRQTLFSSIVLCGGLVEIPGFRARFEQDLRKLKIDFHVLTTANPQTTIIQGAKAFASLSDFRSRCVTRNAYVSNRLVENKAAFDYLVAPELSTMN